VWRTDVRLGCAVTLPSTVVDEAVRAVEALLRWSPAPAGRPEWRRFHEGFLDRYGSGAVVALAEVLDPVTGVGLPQHLTGTAAPEGGQDERAMTSRDRTLLRLAQQAALDGSRQVAVDDPSVASPTATPGNDAVVVRPPHVEVCFDVRAATRAQLDGGGFVIGVSTVGSSAVATTGRFLGLVDGADRDRMVAAFAALPVTVSGARLAQVSFPALRLSARTAGVAPQILGQVLAVGEHTRTDALTLRDLAVTADHRRLYLVSRRDNTVIETAAVNALARHATPALARVLIELPYAHTARIAAWDWGAATCLPFRPRVRHGRAVLAPAAWTLDPHRPVRGAGARPPERGEVERLRDRHGWPRFVHVGRGDRQLRLDLDRMTDVDLLRAHLGRATTPVEVAEAPSPDDHGWLDGRAHEVVLPLASTAAPVTGPVGLTRRIPVVVGPHHGDLPGAEASGDTVLSARLACHPDAVDAIVVDHLPALIGSFDVPPPWWFLRHRTPSPFLRLRLHVPRYGEATERVGAWAARLRRRGLSGDLVLDTYRPELARYGGGAPARRAAEGVFVADSAAARTQIALAAGRRRLDPTALTAASMIDLLGAAHDDRSAASAWLVRRSDLATGTGRTDRDQLAQVFDLLDPGASDHGLVDVWRDRAAAVCRYAREVGHPDEPLADTVLVSLLHLHHVRARGVDPAGENRCHRLARSAALSLLARPSRASSRPDPA
jgi:thiopeptide-type bacteriocin biosynthesis protein